MEITDTDILNYIEKNPSEFGIKADWSYEVFSLNDPYEPREAKAFVDLRSKVKKILTENKEREEREKLKLENLKELNKSWPT